MIQPLLGHEKLETTARYARVATGLISKIESPLDGLSVPRRKRARRDTEEPPIPSVSARGLVPRPCCTRGARHSPIIRTCI